MQDEDDWVESFIKSATVEELHTLLNFMKKNFYSNELIKILDIKIKELY